MGFLITTDLETFIHNILDNNKNESAPGVAMTIASSLKDTYLREDIRGEEYPQMLSLISTVIEEPCHPKNTPEQDLWCKARGISHELLNEKHCKNGYVKGAGRHHYTTDRV